MRTDEKEQPPKSYRESLLQNVNSRQNWWEWARNEDEDDTEDYGADTDFTKVLNPGDGITIDFANPLCPGFSFEEKEKERLQRPFRRTLVVKLMGRQPAYGFMLRKLRQFWERKGKIDIFDLENNFYLPEFNPNSEKIESLVAWVRFPELPAPLFDKKFLLNLGNSIGKAIRLDVHTAQRSRGKFARICIELDLTKPLIPSFSVEGNKLHVVYESLNSLCTNCGWYGHNKDMCERFHKTKADEGMEVEVQGGKEFTVLQEDVEQEVGDVNRVHTAAQLDSPLKVSVERTIQENAGVSEVRKERVLTAKNSEVLQSRGLNENQFSVNGSVVPESNMKLSKGKGVNVVEKENLHPGEIQMRTERSSNDFYMVGDEECLPECGRVASKSFVAVLRDLKFRYKVDMVVILEPRVSGNSATKIIKSWGFKYSVRVEAVGFSGGIWMLWNFEDIGVDVLVKEEQFIHCRLNLGPKKMLFSAVYASLCEQRRQQTWDWLHSLAEEINEPWLVAEVRVIPRIGSDHHPLLIKMIVDRPRTESRTFRYEMAWHMHGDFEPFLWHSWKDSEELNDMLDILQQDLKQWNKEVFGRLELRKKRIYKLRRIGSLGFCGTSDRMKTEERRAGIKVDKEEEDEEEDAVDEMRRLKPRRGRVSM
ncbi:hypothetical protein K1719_026861 [Acacia pycnantha]|nr:hypothetical protein K1719_026861 [Acacia pycnantha]